MRTAGEYPIRIRTGGTDAVAVMQGSKRAWSYDDGATSPSYHTDLGLTASFTRWVNNRGQGTQVAAFTVAGTTTFGGITWHSVWNGSNVWGAANGFWLAYSNGGTYATNRYTTALPSGQGVDAFSAFSWINDHSLTVNIGGFIAGRSYVIQLVTADNRGGGIDGRTIEVVPVAGMTGATTSERQRFAYGTDVKYTVISVRFIATADVVAFRPDCWEADGRTAGGQLNAVNILQDVLPEGKFFYVANDGSDDNDGMSRDTPWATISRVHERTYKPGDCILFKRGHKWTGQRLNPAGSGSAGQPIVIGAYGEGAHPLLEANAASDSAILLSGQPYWIVDGLEVTNWIEGTQFVTSWTWGGGVWSPSHQNASYRYGIKADSCNHLVIRNCYVHDVLGFYLDRTGARQTGGIYVSGAYADDTLVEHNTVENVMGVGILVRAADLHPDTPAGTWMPQVMTNVVVRGNTVFGSAADNIIVIMASAPLIEHNHSGFSGLTACWPSQIAGLWMQFAINGTQQYNHSHSSKTWLGWEESYDAQGLGVDYNMSGEAFIHHNFTHDNFGGMLLDYNYNGDGAVVTCHHNISLCEPRLTSGRPEKHYHDMFVAPDDDYLLHWGAGNLKFRYNAVNAASMSSATSMSESIGNQWYPMAKPSNDTTGASSNPLFSAAPGRLIFRDTMALYDVGDRDPNRPSQGNGQTEPRWLGALRNLPSKYLRLGTLTTFEMGGGGVINNAGTTVSNFDYRVLRVNANNGFLAIAANLAAGVTRPLTIRLQMRSLADPAELENWIAVCLRGSAFGNGSPHWVNDSATAYGLLLRNGGGGTQRFMNGGASGSSVPWAGRRGPTFYHIFEVVLTDAAGSGSPFAGSSTRVRIYCDGLMLDDATLSTPLTALYFGLNGMSSRWAISAIEVFEAAGMVDRFRAYEGLVPQAASPLLNGVPEGTDPLPAGTLDFFGNVSDSTPNRGAIEVTTLASYAQTATRIEIRGRYAAAKPSSGSLAYNLTAIVRDQNNRVYVTPVAWSLAAAVTGVSIDASTGIVTITSAATSGARVGIKAAAGGITARFSFTVV